MIDPTVGRRVWYWPSEYDRSAGMIADGKQPCDAGIAYVHSARMVNLTVADHNGNLHARTSVTLMQEGDAPVPGAYAQWMPYQKGQAKAAA
jgi:hypothetical protein